MEADWEFEVGGGALVGAPVAPVIDALWPGFVDLRREPERAGQLPEAAQFPALAVALTKLNAAASPVWTAKCDLWPQLDPGECDADELDAPLGCRGHLMGCYIDLLSRSGQQWAQPELAAAEGRRVCGLLRVVPLRCCRADLVIRRAFITPDHMDLGMTAYLTSCGATAADAVQTLEAALLALTDALVGQATIE